VLRSQLRARHGLGLESVATIRLRRILAHGVQLVLLQLGSISAVTAELVEAALTSTCALKGLSVVVILLWLHLRVLFVATFAQLAANGHACLVLRLARRLVRCHTRHCGLQSVRILLIGLRVDRLAEVIRADVELRRILRVLGHAVRCILVVSLVEV
jgi:hypothetical protein